MKRQPAPITSWDDLPLVVGIDLVCKVWGMGVKVLYAKVQQRTFPAPTLTHPMRWSRSDLEKHWRGEWISKPHLHRRSA